MTPPAGASQRGSLSTVSVAPTAGIVAAATTGTCRCDAAAAAAAAALDSSSSRSSRRSSSIGDALKIHAPAKATAPAAASAASGESPIDICCSLSLPLL